MALDNNSRLKVFDILWYVLLKNILYAHAITKAPMKVIKKAINIINNDNIEFEVLFVHIVKAWENIFPMNEINMNNSIAISTHTVNQISVFHKICHQLRWFGSSNSTESFSQSFW